LILERSVQPASEVATPSNQDSQGAPEPLRGRSRPKRSPITTLADFFGRRATKAPTFLKDLRQADRWEFDPDDVHAALETHAERDKDFSRTAQLIAAALKERDGRFARPIVAFGEAAIRRRLSDNPYFGGRDLDVAGSARERIDFVARGLGPRLRESKRRAESTNILLATILCVSRDGGLTADDALARLVTALEIESQRSTDRQRAQLVWLGEKPKDVRPVLELTAPWIRAAGKLEERASELEERVEDESAGRKAAEAEVARLSTRLAELEKGTEDAKVEIKRLEEGLRAADVHTDHDAKRLKARLAGALDGQLRDLVTTIDEALSIDPPHVEIAREKVDVVLRELERQVSWLRS
jgi:hypothetical protein